MGVSVAIDIDDVPVRVVPLIDRNRVCTARDVDDLIVWYVYTWSALRVSLQHVHIQSCIDVMYMVGLVL